MIHPRPSPADDAYLRAAESRWGAPLPPDGPAFLGDCILAPKGGEPISSQYGDAPLDHPNIAKARELFETWPEAREGFGAFVNRFWPLSPVEDPGPNARGSVSGHEIVGSDRCCYVTVYDAYGCYEGLLHEWGHLRLRAIGIDLEEHDGAILDHPADEPRIWVSPIRRDVLRPMSAVLHGVYCWVLFGEGDLRLAEDHPDAVRSTLSWNLPKLEEGILTIGEHARWVDRDFGEAFLSWADGVVSQGWDFCGRENRDRALAANWEWVQTQPVSESVLHEGRA